jgi:ribonuclease BN (tRNA processing enzyme)
MRILLLGTGTPNPSLRRMGSGYLVTVGQDVILFDHGPGAFHRLFESGIAPTRVSHLFFSHLHYDHCMDYARLVLTRWDQGAGTIPELKVFGPSHTSRMTDALFGSNGAFAPDIATRISHQPSVETYVSRGGVPPRVGPNPQVSEIENGSVIEGNGWRVTCTTVPHAQPYLHCYGFRLDSPDGSFAYSGDAGRSPEFINLVRHCDVLIHMCHQISGTAVSQEWIKGAAGHLEVAAIGAEANVKNLVVSHIPSQMDVPGIRERLIIEMAEIFKGNIIWGEDLMEIPLTAPEPANHTG